MLQFRDCAVSAEFKNDISIAVNRQVHALDRAITSTGIPQGT